MVLRDIHMFFRASHILFNGLRLGTWPTYASTQSACPGSFELERYPLMN